MPKSALEKAIEKQMKQAKDAERKREREARKEAVRTRAASVVGGQPLINGFRIMDETAEEILKCLLSHKDENSSRVVFEDNIFPDYAQMSIGIELEKLIQYGMIGGLISYDNGGFCDIFPTALAYFENKEKALQQETELRTVEKRTMYDVFISHANADKADYVDELKCSLDKLKVQIFYDKDTLEWGDNWKDKILDGVAKAEFAIIVISENFFGREWTENELTEFLNRQNANGQKIILPILHNITVAQLKEKYPVVADIQALDSSKYTCDEIALKFAAQLIKRLKS